jgi:carboxylate-amine ligase
VYGEEPPGILQDRIDHELFKCTIETQTPLIEQAQQAREHLLSVREALIEYASDHGYRIAASGLHPTACWRELEHAEKPRYKSQLDRIQYPQHRNTTAGLHVHVGVDDADKATWIANELRWFLAPILALSANSPYWNDFDTGLASARAKIFEALPNTGVPTRFEDFESYHDFERRMVEQESINDRGELWYDVRPHTGHGTVEIRTPDAQRDPDRVLAFVEYIHALVLDLADRYEDGADGGVPWTPDGRLRREFLDENKWRALRHGHEASFVAPQAESSIPLSEVVAKESDRLGVSGIREIFAGESGAARQRRLRENDGTDALCEALCLD